MNFEIVIRGTGFANYTAKRMKLPRGIENEN